MTDLLVRNLCQYTAAFGDVPAQTAPPVFFNLA